MATELNYRLALTLNSLVQFTSDTATGVDSSVNIQLANGTYMTANNIRSAVTSLLSVNARPLFKDGYFGGIMHPNVARDVYNDQSWNGLTDILKRGDDGRAKLLAPAVNEDIVEFAGVRFKSTTTAPTVTIGGK